MLVIFGANGRTGAEVVREALRQGLTVRPVVRDDRDGRGLDKIIDVQHVSYADPDHPDSLGAVLKGATQVISCIDARTAGHGCPVYGDQAGVNILQAAADAGASCILHLSVVGAYRWSPNPLNRRGFHVDKHVRQRKDLPWSMLRVSCYADEIIDGHIMPPDGKKPHRVLDSSRYSPITRSDVARVVINHLPELVPGRTLYVGGPETYTGQELRALIAPYLQRGDGWRRTSYGALPPGDVAVDPDVTRIMVTTKPVQTLLHALDPSKAPPPVVEQAPVYARVEPGPHPSDQGRDLRLLRAMGDDLRRVVHSQLVADLDALGLPTDGVQLDFRSARTRKNGQTHTVHEGVMCEMTGVIATTPDGEPLHRGTVRFVWDALADEFFVWFDRKDGVPLHVWEQLDMGVRRRMVTNQSFAKDKRVQGFSSGRETTASPN